MTIASDLISLQINLDPFHVTYLGSDGWPFLEQNSGEYDAPGYLTVLPFGFSNISGWHPTGEVMNRNE
ncbi:MAG: hypothetical protein GTO03_15605 [Planctomycetales bacterium]|nr:hypothetical protein [Planctomycetales bacterium]